MSSGIGSWVGQVFSIFMVVSPSYPYIPQYRIMEQSKSLESFSELVCCLLIVSNTIRVFFWFGARFDQVLLWQAVVTVGTQLILQELCVRLRQKKLDRKRTIWNSDVNYFWAWDDFSSYVIFLAGMCGTLSVVSLFFAHMSYYFEFLGFLALAIEALLGLPQVYRLHNKKSTAGLSLFLISSWFLGDAFKTGYFLYTGAPFQFVACGTFQFFIDCIILGQFAMYSKKNYNTKQSL